VNLRIQQLVAQGKWFYYYRDHFLIDSVLDFVGYGEAKDNFDKNEQNERSKKAEEFLNKIGQHPEIHHAFWMHIANYYVQITDRDRNAPLFIAAANFLSGRRLDRNEIVGIGSILNNKTIQNHPWYGELENAQKPPVMRTLPSQKRDKVRVLLIGAAERDGINQKAVYLRMLLEKRWERVSRLRLLPMI